MFKASDSTIDLARGGNWFKPLKFITQKGTCLIKNVAFTTGGGGVVDIAVEGKYVVDRALQAKRIGGTALAAGVAGSGLGAGGYYALNSGQVGEGQTPSIEQLTGLE